ncbi:MAG: S8 family serine peptidase [Caldilineales bacterium]|nr:S8 family serine peptidase [Caldilineales bacterium]
MKRRSLGVLLVLLILACLFAGGQGMPPAVAALSPPDPLTGKLGKLGAARDDAHPHAPEYVLVQMADLAEAEAEGYEPIFADWYKAPVHAGESVSGALERLSKSEQILTVEMDYIYQVEPLEGVGLHLDTGNAPEMRPNDTYYSYQWHFPMVQAEAAWDRSRGQGVKVAVIDTGVAKGSDLACHTFVDEFNAVTNRSGAGSALDDQGHGTHVAGTIAQCTNNGAGVAGLAHAATLMPIKVLGRDGSGTASDIAQGIDWARSHGARVINLSLGGDCGTQGWPACSQSIMNTALAAAAAADIVIVAASGNSNERVVGFPANHPQVIAVGAVETRQQRAPYSNYGAALTLVAPGGDTNYDRNQDNYDDGVLQQTFTAANGWAYYFWDGTSMATPHVTAAVAMLRSFRTSATRVEIQQALQSSARDLGAAGFDQLYGHGLLQIHAALDALGSGGADTTPPDGQFTSPTNGAQVTAPVWLRVTAQDTPGGSGVARVKFTTNGSGRWALLTEDTSPPFEYQWLMTGVPAQTPFMVGAEIYDVAGNRANRVITITRVGGNPPPDFTSPANNAEVVPPLLLRVEGATIARVYFTSNCTGAWQRLVQDVAAPFEFLWDMANVPNGRRCMVGAEIYDAANQRTDRIRWITKRATTDTTPPTGSFLEPAPNAVVNAPLRIRVQAQDNAGGSGIARVRFTSNGAGSWRAIADDTTAPYEIVWDMSGVPADRAFMIGAEIYDNAGNRIDIVRSVRSAGGAAALVNGGFEQGREVGWRSYSSNGWHLIFPGSDLPGTITPHGGAWAAWLGGDDNELSALTQRVTIPQSHPTLRFWYWIASQDYCGYDFGGVVINNTQLADAFTLCSARDTNGWVLRTVDLSAFAGQTVELQLRADTDGSLNSNLFIDDVALGQATLSLPDAAPALPPDAGQSEGKATRLGPAQQGVGQSGLESLWPRSREPKP